MSKMNRQPNAIDQLKKGLSDQGLTTRSIVAFVIFGMIVIVFVLSDLTGRHKGSSSMMGSAADVNGELISIKDFQEEENRLSQYYSQLFGGQFDNELQRNMLKGEVMNSLVNKSIAAQAAEKEGIYATDAEVRHMIVEELPYFKRDGVFQSDAYKAILNANRLTPGEFEAKLRKDIKNQRSRYLFETSLSLTELQKNMEKELRSSKINLEFIPVSLAEFQKSNSVSSAEISKLLADPSSYKKVEDNYNLNQSKYETKEQVRASHILVKADANNDAEAKSKAEKILSRLKKEDFGKVAAEVSDDPGSKVKKGDLGFFGQGQMVPEFEKAAFSLPIGQVSDLVKSNFGYHIIKVTEKKPYSKTSLDTVKNEIAKNIILEDQYSGFVKDVESKLSESKVDEAIALLKQAKLNWKETGFFDIASEVAPVINSAQAIKMGLNLNKENPIANRLVREGDMQYLIRLKDTKIEAVELNKPDQEKLEKQKSSSAYSAWVDSFKKSAKIEVNHSLTSTAQ